MSADTLIKRVKQHQKFLQTHAGIDTLYHQTKVREYTKAILANAGPAALEKLWPTINEAKHMEVSR